MNRNGAPGDAAIPVVPGGANAVVPPGSAENQTTCGLTPAGSALVITVPDGVKYVDSGPDTEGAGYMSRDDDSCCSTGAVDSRDANSACFQRASLSGIPAR